MLRIIATTVVAIIGIIVFGTASAPPETSAHEVRAVGNYQFVVGFLNEPAFAYEPSGLDLIVTFFPNGVPEGEEAEGEGQPVEGLEETLQAEVIAGGGAATKEIPIEPAFGDPGVYESPMIFSAPGDYSFHIFGEIEGQEIDETFVSGPETFGPMENPNEIEFPDQLAPPATTDGSSDSTSDSSSDSSSSDDTARIIAIIGIIVGVIGIAVAGLALAARRS
jgi:hypothetical protein